MGLQDYLKETRAEMKHVSWPTRRQVFSYTLVVVAVSLATSLYLGLFDFLFGLIIDRFIIK